MLHVQRNEISILNDLISYSVSITVVGKLRDFARLSRQLQTETKGSGFQIQAIQISMPPDILGTHHSKTKMKYINKMKYST